MAAPHDLDALHAAVWQELARAVTDRDHAWRLGVLATVDDGRPDARTVVLREVEPAARLLRLYTDARSAKVRQLLLQPRGCLVLWSPGLSWQVRLDLELAVDRDGLAVSSRWARLALTSSARDYLSPLAPGADLEPTATPAPPLDRRNHFAVLHGRVLGIDWLEIGVPHRRAAWSRDGAGRWLQP
ncbi:pyridoxamine 5'-phosphate oxidase family protein [Aquabacterium sp. J223]|uniref:pyridoxamine 5'-phosphate oxidase family protein n=1 Tax=Aquabacterium sp. J223 TaxID=2898431 RepID=UPI0021ADBFE7|nr:pyridoxamine 5'-phosphate oxidase family protein [Aquabacterium sp. J223]UUX96761.1 pyridoxamine 5'-phosphate oxidase family protein [Aquabacterium sp. J223]